MRKSWIFYINYIDQRIRWLIFVYVRKLSYCNIFTPLWSYFVLTSLKKHRSVTFSIEVFCQEVKVTSDLCKIIVQFWAHYFILAWPGSRFIQRMNTSKFLCKISSFSNLVYRVHECKLCAVNFKLPVYIFVMLTISKGPTERMRIISEDLLWS